MKKAILIIAVLLIGLFFGKAMAVPTFEAAGTAIGARGVVSPAWPAHAVNDIALLFVESRGNQAATLSTAAGFVAVANSPQFTGSDTRITVFWARATSTTMAAPTVADPGDHVYARILTYRSVVGTGNPWDITGGGVKAAASTSVTVTGVTTTVADTLIVQAVARDNDSAAAAFSAQANTNLTNITERSDAGTTQGDGGGFGVWDGVKTTASATGNTTATVTNSINAFLTIALKPLLPPTVAKSFSPATIGTGGSSTLTVTLSNANATAITGAAFTDTYPANVTNTATPGLTNTCGGTATGSANGSSLALSGGTIPANGSCTVTVAVTSAVAGSYLNNTGAVTTANAGSGTAATATLTVLSRPTVAKSFSPSTIGTGGTSTLTVTLTNANATAITAAAFTDVYPANLLNTATPGAATTCTGGTVTAAANGASLALSGGTIPASGSCTVTVAVTSAVAGSYLNNTGSVTTTNAGSGTAATAILTVTAPTVAKSFSPATIAIIGTSTLTITLSNATATAFTGAAFTDTYPANLLNAATLNTTNSCGGTVTAAAAGSSLALSGGTIPANGSCTVTVAVTSAVQGSYLNNTGPVTTTNGGTGTAATAILAVNAPTVAKSFSPATIAINGTSTLNITLSNATATAFTGAAFTDTYPANVTNTGTPGLTNTCGGTATAATNGSSLALSGGTIPANGSCTVTVAVTSAVAGSYLNNTGSVTTTNSGPGQAATATLTVLAAPTVAKSFSPATIGIGGSSTLTVTLSNANATAITGAAFTDTYPANVTNTGTPGLTNTCGGTATATANGSSLALSGGGIPASGSCTVTVAVTSAVAGSYLNSTGSVTTTNAGSGTAATATLTVLSRPTVAKSFSPATIGNYGTSTLTVTLSNANATAITGAAFSDTYPANVTNTGTPGLTNTCGGTAIGSANGSSLALSAGTIPASGSCTVTVAVTSAVAGSYLNNTGAVTTTNAGSGTAATATLTVTAPTVAKSFSPATIAINGTSTLTITLSNATATAFTGAAFTDVYPADLLNAATPALTNSCGGTATAAANGTSLTLSGGTIPANGSCTVTVAVTSALSGSYLNSTGPVTTTNGGTGTAATATLAVNAPTVAKSFSPATIAINGTSTLNITLSNATATAFTGAAFTDTYPANLLNAATLNTTNSCGGTVTAAAAGGSLALSGGTIPANGSCTVTVAVTSAVAGSYLNNTGAVTTANSGDGVEATATLTVQSVILGVTKTTSTPTIVNTSTGTTATYTVTVSNTGTGTATGVVLTDTLPAGFTFASNTAPVLGGGATRTAISDPAVGTTTPAWDTFSLPASGGNVAITFVANVASTVADDLYNNSASVTATNATSITNFDGTPTATTVDNVTVTSAVLAVTKTTSTPTVTNTASGTTATYTITVANTGTANATGVKVSDTLATGFTYASTSSVTLNGAGTTAYTASGTTTASWDTSPTGGFTINAGQNLVITFVANVSSAVASGTYNNSASATSTNARTISNFVGANNTSDDVTVNTPTGVSLYGTAYNDLSHNLQLDGGESGTGLTLYAKLVPSAGGSALQAVAVNPSTGAYTLVTVTPGNYSIILDDNNVLTDTTPTVPGGWIGTEMPDFRRTNVQVATTDLQNLNFGLFNGGKLSGFVFADVGTGAGTANNGTKDGSEAGIAGVTVKVTNVGGTATYDSSVTSADGGYTLWIPSAAVAATLKIVETNLSGTLSTGASMGNTGGSYDRASDSITFGNVSGGIFTGVNFGDVPVNRFVANGQQSGSPGNVVFYPHQFNAGSGGSVSITVTSATSWPVVLYRDSNCNGVIDAGENVIGAAMTVLASEQICLINKVTIPPGTALGAQDTATLQASFTYTNANPGLSATLAVIDSTTVGAGSAGLVLTKTTDKATAVPGDIINYTVSYQNNSSTPLATIVISDATPAFTTFVSAGCTLPLPAAITACSVTTQPVVGGQGGLQWTLTGVLNPASAGQVVFAVKVN